MPRNINLSREIEKQLPTELVEFVQTAGLIAASQGRSLYLVGGMVRDLLLKRTNLDLDLVVEGDAIGVAQSLSEITGGQIVIHKSFNTAKLRWDKWSVDLATARSETYDRPGALPRVKPGYIASDLFRRDFTVNAMAVELIPGHYGHLIDMYGGWEDLRLELIRVLHDMSFIDDSTRIWRALRYEQRLNFHIETNTLGLLKRDTPMLDTISADRLRHELELILKEEIPEKVIIRADELRVLPRLHRALKGDSWLAEKFSRARETNAPNLPSVELYMALLAYRMTAEENEELISRLRLRKSLAETLRDTNRLKNELGSLAESGIAPSVVYSLLHGCSATAIAANSLATDSQVVRQNIQTYLTRLRYVKPALTGDDLKEMGIAPGPRMKEILQRLHEARLDGKVKTKKDEEEMVRGWTG